MKQRQGRSLFAAAAMAVAALGIAGSMPASAQQQPAPITVGVVDADGIVQDSKAFKSLTAQAEKTQKQIKSDFDKQQKQFDDDGRALVQQKDTLSADDLQKKKVELRQRADRQTAALNVRQRNLEQSVTKSRVQIVQAMADVVKDVAAARGLTFVVTRSITPYFDPSYDISQEVKRRLDAKLPSLKLQQSSASDTQ
jgi:Skp family chaperone for outer membrane proteins